MNIKMHMSVYVYLYVHVYMYMYVHVLMYILFHRTTRESHRVTPRAARRGAARRGQICEFLLARPDTLAALEVRPLAPLAPRRPAPSSSLSSVSLSRCRRRRPCRRHRWSRHRAASSYPTQPLARRFGRSSS